MTVTYKSVKLFSAAIYEPSTTGPDRQPSRPKYYVSMREIDNPDRSDIPWRTWPSTGEPRTSYNSVLPPRITMRKPEFYLPLIKLHEVFRARNIPLDRMLRGATCDIVLDEWHKSADETVLQLSELIFDHMDTFNTNGDIPT